jgi:primase-polymerase (primpol)-like protein
MEKMPHVGDLSTSKEHPMRVAADNIPHVLRVYQRPQWVCWRYEYRQAGKKPDKKPINAKTLGYAGPRWPNSWSTFDTAYATYLRHYQADTPGRLDGVGFFLSAEDPFVAVDLDDCVDEHEISSNALEVIQALQSYSEISPSGRGIRILVAAPALIDNFKSREVEIYMHSRYVTLTGQQVAGTPSEVAFVDASRLQSLRPQRSPVQAVPATRVPQHEGRPFEGTDMQLWERIFRYDKYGAEHRMRFGGSTALDHEDHSLTVIRLLNALARWTGGDTSRMRAMMLMSPLANEKWLSKRGAGDWLDYQIANAIEYVKQSR